ncbi:hypothetical protein [Rhizobium oryziradicis]|uniref:hypothetical protein n=1 Tax=Rhizobium oryziradicis TaxID=1867956 RepID=UPI000A949B48|nr:hypothetical protein [Rhizobium oryziradicis]
MRLIQPRPNLKPCFCAVNGYEHCGKNTPVRRQITRSICISHKPFKMRLQTTETRNEPQRQKNRWNSSNQIKICAFFAKIRKRRPSNTLESAMTKMTAQNQ